MCFGSSIQYVHSRTAPASLVGPPIMRANSACNCTRATAPASLLPLHGPPLAPYPYPLPTLEHFPLYKYPCIPSHPHLFHLLRPHHSLPIPLSYFPDLNPLFSLFISPQRKSTKAPLFLHFSSSSDLHRRRRRARR